MSFRGIPRASVYPTLHGEGVFGVDVRVRLAFEELIIEPLASTTDESVAGGSIPNEYPASGASATTPEPALNESGPLYENVSCVAGEQRHRVAALPRQGWHWSV